MAASDILQWLQARRVSRRAGSMGSMSDDLRAIARDLKQVSALLKIVFRLMELWKLDTRQQTTLLGVRSVSTIYRWKNHGTKRLRLETLERMAHLLAIHKLLRLFFPRNRDMAYNWIWTRNKAACFGGKRPIDIMLRGKMSDLFLVRDYRDHAAG